METTTAHRLTSPSPVVHHPVSDRHSAERRFYLGASVLAIAVVAVGFGRGFAPGAPHLRPLTPLVMVHAAVFATWIVLFAVQSSLIAAGRRTIHKRLGLAGAGLAILMLALGFATAVRGARTGYAPVPGGDALRFLIVPLGDLVVFGSLVGAALYWRGRPDLHKRLMWIATAALTYPAVARLPHVRGSFPVILAVFLAIMSLAPLYERIVFGKVHRVLIWVTIPVFLSVPLRGMVGRTAAWHHFAAWLIR